MKDDVFPIGLKLDGLPCLVVGSGEEAPRRAEALFRAGARVTAVSGSPPADLAAMEARGELVLARRAFVESDFEGVWLAVLTDLNAPLAERMQREAARRRTFFCAVDQPAYSTYSHPALVREGPLVVAVSTSGRAPALARRLKEELARLFAEAGIQKFIDRLAELRAATPSAERRETLGRAVSAVRFTGKVEIPEE